MRLIKQQGKSCTLASMCMVADLDYETMLKKYPADQDLHIQTVLDELHMQGFLMMTIECMPSFDGIKCIDMNPARRIVYYCGMYRCMLYQVLGPKKRHMYACDKGQVVDPRTGNMCSFPHGLQYIFPVIHNG